MFDFNQAFILKSGETAKLVWSFFIEISADLNNENSNSRTIRIADKLSTFQLVIWIIDKKYVIQMTGSTKSVYYSFHWIEKI